LLLTCVSSTMSDLITPEFAVNVLSSPYVLSSPHDMAKLGAKGRHMKPTSFRRRPRPGNLGRVDIPPLELARIPHPPFSKCGLRPFSIPLVTSSAEGFDTVACSIDTNREAATSLTTDHGNDLQDSVAFVSVACDVEVVGEASRRKDFQKNTEMVEQSCQTDERAFTEQLDAIIRENAMKSKEMRKMRETLQILQAEVRQERLMSEQFRSQVEILEEQLCHAMEKQRRAETDRALATWHMQNGGGRRARSTTPQPRIPPPKEAWCGDVHASASPTREANPCSRESLKVTHDAIAGSESDCDSSEGEPITDNKKIASVFHPPPKHMKMMLP